MKAFFSKFTQDHAEVWKFIKFLLTCGGTSILYFVIYYLCEYVFFKHLNATPVTDNPVLSFLGIKFVGTACSYFIASFCSFAASYVINRKVTFKSNSNLLFSTVLYTIMTVLTVAFTTWFGAFMKTVLYDHNLDGGILEVLMPCIVMCIPFLWTYPLQRFVIYKNKADPAAEEAAIEAEEAAIEAEEAAIEAEEAAIIAAEEAAIEAEEAAIEAEEAAIEAEEAAIEAEEAAIEAEEAAIEAEEAAMIAAEEADDR